MLLDRIEERAAVDRLLDAVRSGLSEVLVLRGEPGVGKTALLDYAAEEAADLQVTRITAVESEMGLDFAGLHQLLIPFLPRVDRLPMPQRRALRSALGLSAGPAPDRFLVGLATLTLLAEAAAERRLLILVDDAQWLDDETAEVLPFVARRLHADGIGLLLALRGDAGERISVGGLPALQVDGLPESAARELIGSLAPGPVDEQVGGRIIAATRANPLALVELSTELSATELAGGEILPEPLPVGPRLEQRFLRCVRLLPPETRLLVLLAAADPTGDPRVFWEAAAALGIGVGAAPAAEAEGLLVFQPTIAFRHPLIRSAVYSGAAAADRRKVHAALAEASDSELDADRRAWHRALAAVGPDEEVAEELERAADGARRRGGYAASAAFLQRAAALSPDARRGAGRLLAAAEAQLTRGAPDKAAELLNEATPLLSDPLGHALGLRLRGDISFALGDAVEAARTSLTAACALEPLDDRLARETLLASLRAAGLIAGSGGEDAVQEVAHAALAAVERSTRDPTVADLLLEGLAARRTHAPYAEVVPPLRRAIRMLRDGEASDDARLRWLILGWIAASDLMEEEARDTLARQWVRLARDRGALTSLSQALIMLGVSEAWAGRLDASDACFVERREINEAIGFSGVGGREAPHHVIVLAWRGRDAEARALAEEVLLEATERGHGQYLDFVQYALAVLDVGLGRYDSAQERASVVFENDPPYIGVRVLPELVEAAARTGDDAAATRALDRLAERARASGTPWGLGLLARCRAQLADADAEALYREAIEYLQGHLLAPERARSHLLYGEWLRRQRRRLDAREHLRVAYEMLANMGGEGFAERARGELLATGARARRRTQETRDDLTPQELRIARLAADGATNSEIAAQLFISPSTVEYHLRKVFRKLGVTSRFGLVRKLPAVRQPEEPSTPAVR